ncbi:MAG: hypothetical protein ACRC9L_06920 [Brevinema sp.]
MDNFPEKTEKKTSRNTVKPIKKSKDVSNQKKEALPKKKKAIKPSVSTPKDFDTKVVELHSSKVTPKILSPEVVVLPQSHNKVFLVWRAEPTLDESTDSWVVRSSFGELARVPARSRSAFLTGAGQFDIDIYRVSKEGSEEFFTSHKVNVQGYNNPSKPQELGRLNSSSSNFRRRISS